MIIEHRGAKPEIDDAATVSPAAIISGDVTIGPHTQVLAGAVLTAEGAPLRIGSRCVIMEQAVIRGAGPHPCTIADHVLIGPHAHISGATIECNCFIATGATILNDVVLGEGSVVAVNGIVHIGARCPPGTFVPLAHIASGQPALIYPPSKALAVHEQIAAAGFTDVVFGFNSSQMSNGDATRELCDRYTNALSAHRGDRIIS